MGVDLKTLHLFYRLPGSGTRLTAREAIILPNLAIPILSAPNIDLHITGQKGSVFTNFFLYVIDLRNQPNISAARKAIAFMLAEKVNIIFIFY